MKIRVLNLQKVNVGLIGAGKMGLLHAGIFSCLENSRLTSVAEKNKIMGSALDRYIPQINVYSKYEKMFKKEELDAVVVTTPVFLHKPMIEDAIDHGLHIFVEKPMAINGEECDSIFSKGKKGIITSVGYCRRFMGTYRFVKDVIENKLMGNVNSFQSQIFVEQVFQKENGWLYDPEKSGGGVLMDLGSHAVDLFHFLIGNIKLVQASSQKIYSEDVEDFASINFKFNNNILGSLQASWSMKGYRLPELRINIQFDEGTVSVTEKYVEIYSEIESEPLKEGWNTFYKQDLVKDVPLDIGGPEYTMEDLHFLDCISNDKESLCNFNESSKVNYALDAVYNSIKDGNIKKVRYGV